MTTGNADQLPNPEACAPVCAHAVHLISDLRSWNQRYGGVVSDVRLTGIGMFTAFIAPWLGPEELAPTARVVAWCCALDDYADNKETSPEEVATLIDVCRRVLNGEPPDTADPIVGALAAVRAGVAGRRLPAAHARAWNRSLDRVLSATLFECEARHHIATGLPAPSVEDYLARSTGSILVEVFALNLCIAEGRKDAVSQLTALAEALSHAEYAVRLANDLASHRRERAAGDINAIMLGMGQEEARRRVAAHTGRCREVLHPFLRADPHGCAVMLDRAVGLFVGIPPSLDTAV
ncbi:terpene synthase family protein [Streptomyces sp. NPDC007861]|uniref:terpene synthase family protein n=1 Tax=Streptomyces sp. NPDC007861 TaxID=3154893 RepID=UPI0033EDACF0